MHVIASLGPWIGVAVSVQLLTAIGAPAKFNDSDDLMRTAIQDRIQTSYHPCGTNRLSKNISQGVVDPALKVHGIDNLRVVDASVFPIIPNCRIQNTVYMVAKMGADLIKADHTDLFK